MRESLPDKWYIDTKEVPEAGVWFNSQLDHCGAYTNNYFKHISSHNNKGVRIGTDRKAHHSFSNIHGDAIKITREEFLHFIINQQVNEVTPLFLN